MRRDWSARRHEALGVFPSLGGDSSRRLRFVVGSGRSARGAQRGRAGSEMAVRWCGAVLIEICWGREGREELA
jgi:hypothetical protein